MTAIVILLIQTVVSTAITTAGFAEEEAAKAVVDPQSPSLTTEEQSACRSALREAEKLGFPDLTGAMVTARGLRISSSYCWDGYNNVHIRLADGTWLYNECIPLPQESITASGDEIKPYEGKMEAGEYPFNFLPAQARLRAESMSRISNLRNNDFELGLAAIAWWQSGLDPDGQTLISTVLRNAAIGQDRGTHLHSLDSAERSEFSLYGNGTTCRAGAISVPDIETGVRRMLSAWFRARIAIAESSDAAERWKNSAIAIMSASDRPLLLPLIERLRRYVDLKSASDAHAPLIDRLRTWPGYETDLHTGEHHLSAVPSNRDETAELIALIGDDSPSRWIDAMWTPRTVGDNALRALSELWHFDWRWLTMGYEKAESDSKLSIGTPRSDSSPYGDEHVWSRGLWDDDQRHAMAITLAGWWQTHNREGPQAPLAECFRSLPVPLWAGTLLAVDAQESGEMVADRIADRLTAMPPVTDESRDSEQLYSSISLATVLFPAHSGIATSLSKWPSSAWLANLAIIRSGLVGDAIRVDAWLTATLTGQRGPDVHLFSDDPSITSPWENIGLWAYYPTESRLATLRTVMAQELSVPGTRWIIYFAGDSTFPVLGEFPFRFYDRMRYHPGARAIPVAIARIGLHDARELISFQLKEVQEYFGSELPDVNASTKLRVCDWVAARLMKSQDQAFIGWIPDHLRDAKSFLNKPIAGRDEVIAQLAHAIEPYEKRMFEDAGLIKKMVGPSDF